MATDNTLVKAWLHFLCNDDGLPKSTIEETITNTGITTQNLNPHTSDDMGIIFFNDINQQIFDFLREVNCNGHKRVLAIAASSSTLSNGAVWRLLHAGASDVFSWNQTKNPSAL